MPYSPPHLITKSTPRINKGILSLAFLAVLLDGFDTAILALLVPELAARWGTTAAAFTYPLVLTNAGVVLGYLLCGWLSARIGQRKLLVGGITLFGIATVATAATLDLRSMEVLTVTRLLTGIGLGVVLPMAVVLATNNSPSERRQAVSVGITMGLTTGAALAGFLGGPLIQLLGISGLFWLAGLLPLLVAALLVRVPVVATPKASPAEKKDSTVARLFGVEVRSSTTLLWSAAFLIFTVSYTLKSWLPTLLNFYGLDRATAGMGLGFLSLGGLIGGLILIPLSAKLGTAKALIIMSLAGAASVAAVAKIPMETIILLIVIGVAGAGVVAGQVGQTAIAVGLYSQAARATGVGWAAALGRMGSIFGPAIAGVFLALAWPAQDIVLSLVLPVLLTTAAWAILARKSKKTSHASTPRTND